MKQSAAPTKATRKSARTTQKNARTSPRASDAELPSTHVAAPPDAATDDMPPFRPVGFTISTTGYAISAQFHDVLRPLRLDPRELGVLQAVAGAEGMTQQAIAEQLRVPASRMVALVDGLEQRRLLQRRPNPNDRRARALYLTAKGRKLLGRAFAVAVECEQRLTSALTEQERMQLLDLLARVGEQVGVPPGVHPAIGHSALGDA